MSSKWCETKAAAPPSAVKRRAWSVSGSARPESRFEVGSSRIMSAAPLRGRGTSVGSQPRPPNGEVGHAVPERDVVAWDDDVERVRRGRCPRADPSRVARIGEVRVPERGEIGAVRPFWRTQRTPSARGAAKLWRAVAPSPRRQMFPASGAGVPAATFIGVDLRAPWCPTRAARSPGHTRRFAPSEARTGPEAWQAPGCGARALRRPSGARRPREPVVEMPPREFASSRSAAGAGHRAPASLRRRPPPRRRASRGRR